MHMFTETDLCTSKTAKIKKLYYYITAHRRTSMCSSIGWPKESKPLRTKPNQTEPGPVKITPLALG